MIDYIKITKHLSDKDNISFKGLQHIGNLYGKEHYTLQGCKNIQIEYNQRSQVITIKGCITYFIQGHNFTYSTQDFANAIDCIGRKLNCNLWDAIVDEFEYGIIMEVPLKPKEYIQHHREKISEKLVLNEKRKDKGTFRWWKDKEHSLKMYDAGKNAKKKFSKEVRNKLQENGLNFDKNYIKWEVHYLKPHQSLNNGAILKMEDLVSPIWEKKLKRDLLTQYQRLCPQKTLLLPNNKRQISTANILMHSFAEELINKSYTLEEVKKELYNKIGLIPNELLNANDKKARKVSLRKILGVFIYEDSSQWDLLHILEKNISEQ